MNVKFVTIQLIDTGRYGAASKDEIQLLGKSFQLAIEGSRTLLVAGGSGTRQMEHVIRSRDPVRKVFADWSITCCQGRHPPSRGCHANLKGERPFKNH